MYERPHTYLVILICATCACATVDIAALPERPVPALTVSVCTEAEEKALDPATCRERYVAFITRCTASTVRIAAYRYDQEKGEVDYGGTGAILDDTGLVLTAYHVVKDADFILVTVRRIKEHDGTLYFTETWRFPARTVFSSPKRDVALLLPLHPQTTERMIPMHVRIGREPMVGMQVWHFGKTSGVSKGTTDKWPVNSAGTWPVMQTKAPARLGDSGGPVVTREGNLIGIVLSKSETEPLLYYMPIDRALYALREWFLKTRVIEVVPKK